MTTEEIMALYHKAANNGPTVPEYAFKTVWRHA